MRHTKKDNEKLAPIDGLPNMLEKSLFLQNGRDARAELRKVTEKMTEGFKGFKYCKPPKKKP